MRFFQPVTSGWPLCGPMMGISGRVSRQENADLVQQREHLISRQAIYVIGGVLHVD
jgi:hypothetical protein